MISLLRGKIAEKSLGKVILDVQGVGYGVTVPLSTYYRLPELDGETQLKIHTHVREDGIELFGFLSEDEKKLFMLLLGVSGVGPKGATNILSNISVTELISAISSGELSRKKIPGIGPKLASRLVTELKDKVTGIQVEGETKGKAGILEDIVSALLNLGYKKSEIDEHISKIEEVTSSEKDIEKALREALKIMRRV
ncbi:MAG TPA: Holliday junction branch migration protein RuvA [Thermodesulfobacteriota bacterium]|nr:Holliday junction branch migration protein RuvA [Thermodesulfobacteriota bacterium]